jgi:hypothetical protein
VDQLPSIGRIVHYQARGSADGVFVPTPRAAIVTAVNEADPMKVSVTVFTPTGLFFNNDVPWTS